MIDAILEIFRIAGFPTVLLGAVYLLSFGISGPAQPDQEN